MEKFMAVFRMVDKIYKFICFALVGALGVVIFVFMYKLFSSDEPFEMCYGNDMILSIKANRSDEIGMGLSIGTHPVFVFFMIGLGVFDAFIERCFGDEYDAKKAKKSLQNAKSKENANESQAVKEA